MLGPVLLGSNSKTQGNKSARPFEKQQRFHNPPRPAHSDQAKKFLAKDGYDPAYGARPLKRVIQQQILNPLSVATLDGQFGKK